MLFDLGGRRKNFIRVIYAFLALLMGGGLVLLGIGGDASGGLLSAFGIGDDGGTTDADPALERQIDTANETLATNPEDERALLILARTHYLLGNNALQEEDAETVNSEYESADEAWQKYLATKPQKPDDSVATLMVRAYPQLADSAATSSERDELIQRAFEASAIVAEARPSLGTNTEYAFWATLVGDEKAAEQARKDALADAPDDTTKQQVEQSIQQATLIKKSLEQQDKQGAPSEEDLANPLSGLGGTQPTVPGG